MRRRLIVIGILLLIFIISCSSYLLSISATVGNYKEGRTLGELSALGYAINLVSLENQMTPEQCEKVIDSGEFAALVGPKFEQPQAARADRWGQPYVIEKRRTGDQITITVRSTHVPERSFWEKQRVLGVEVTLFRDPDKRPVIKELWKD